MNYSNCLFRRFELKSFGSHLFCYSVLSHKNLNKFKFLNHMCWTKIISLLVIKAVTSSARSQPIIDENNMTISHTK